MDTVPKTVPMPDGLSHEQARLEHEMATRGVAKYRRRLENARERERLTGVRSGEVILGALLQPVVDGITSFTEEATSGRAGRHATAAKFLSGLDPDEVAYAAVKTIVDSLQLSLPLASSARRIGALIEALSRIIAVPDGEPKAALIATTRKIDKSTRNPLHRRHAITSVLSKNGDGWKRWTEPEQLRVGVKLIEIVVLTTGIVGIVKRRVRHKTVLHLEATPRTLTWLESLDHTGGLLSPEYLPCVIPPKDWTGLRAARQSG